MALNNPNIATANPNVVANEAFINALYREAQGRGATTAELQRFAGYKVKDVANIVLGASASPFYTAPGGPAGGGPNQIINQNQQSDFADRSAETDVAIRDRFSDLFSSIGLDPSKPFAPPPSLPSLAEKYLQFREENGVTQLETDLSTLKGEEKAIRQRARERAGYEEGRPVPLGVISGKQTEIQKQANEELQINIDAQRLVTDQLNTKYTMINTLVNLTQTDYQNASDAYDKQFNRAIQTINLMRDVRKDVLDERQAIEDSARANLQIVFNGIEGGTLKWSDLPKESRTLIGKLEVQAGLPVGITKKLKSSQPDAKIISSNTRQESNGDEYADIIMQRPDGSVFVEKVYLGKSRIPSSGGGSDEPTQTELLQGYNYSLNSYGNYVVTSRNPANDDEITREELVDILVQDYPWRSRGEIKNDVYSSFPDDFDKRR